jgi:pantetheine-phosphate adenylyltransferase
MNRKLSQKVETVFLMTDYKWFYISSTIIKEAALFGGNIDGLVPEVVNQRLREKFGFPPKVCSSATNSKRVLRKKQDVK